MQILYDIYPRSPYILTFMPAHTLVCISYTRGPNSTNLGSRQTLSKGALAYTIVDHCPYIQGHYIYIRSSVGNKELLPED